MAETHFNAQEKFRAYHLLACLNRSFRFIVANLYEIEKSGAFDLARLGEFRGLAKELQSEVNSELLEDLLELERKDAFRFGKVRTAREKRLNP